MKRVTRRKIRSWLTPIRRCFAEIKGGEVDSLRGYPVTRIDNTDEYARIDACLCGFRALIERLCPDVNAGSLERIEKRLAAGVPLTVSEVDAALSTLRKCEDALIKRSVSDVNNAVFAEQCCIELERAAA